MLLEPTSNLNEVVRLSDRGPGVGSKGSCDPAPASHGHEGILAHYSSDFSRKSGKIKFLCKISWLLSVSN